MTEPLSQAQKAFHQRIMAAHVFTETEARAVWESLDDRTKFEAALKSCNAQLRYAGLEISAVAMPTTTTHPKSDPDTDDDTPPTASPNRQNNHKALTKYYAMINKFPDEIAKVTFQRLWTPAEHALVRIWLESLVENTFLSRASLINARSKLDAKLSLTLEQSQSLLNRLVDEAWLRESNQGKNARPGSMQAAIVLAPRTYLELSYMLMDEFGMDANELPQQFKYME
jgi:hypothetical protein